MHYVTKFAHFFKKFTKLQIILVVVGVIFIGMQVERLASQGTFLGYQIFNKQQAVTENPFSPFNAPSKICGVITAEKVEDILKQKVVRFGIIADRKKPTPYSTCSYRTTKAPIRTLTINQQEVESETQAKSNFATLKNSSKGESIKGLGDEAYFSQTSSQLSVRSKNVLVTIKVTNTQDTKKPSAKEAAQQIAKLAVSQ